MKKKILLLGLFLTLSAFAFAQKFDSCIILKCNESFDPRSLHPLGFSKTMMDSMEWNLPLPCVIKSLNKRLPLQNKCIKGILYTDNTKDSTVQNSCNQFTTPTRGLSYCIKTDSIDKGSIWTKIFAIKDLVLNSFISKYNLPLNNSQSVPTNDPNNPKKLIIKVWKNGILLKRVEQTIISTHVRDTNFLVTFHLGGIAVPAGDSLLLQVFGAEPEYTSRDPRDMSLWDFNGFKLNYHCIDTCSWQGPINRHQVKESCREINYWSWWSPDCGDYIVKLVTPIDSITPTMVCRTSVISLNAPCTRFPAYALDAGSRDNCASVTFSARRMDQQNFNDYIEFCCADVGKTVMVVLRGTDQCRNYNDCMVEVEVQDKLPPVVVCPRDTLIECSQLDTSNWNNLGVPKVTDNCSTTTLKEDRKVDLNMCGVGIITRTWTATDGSGNMATCSQTIAVANSKPFGESNIIWPRDTTIECASTMIDPDKLGRPRFVGLTNCMMPLYNFHDQVFGTNKGGSCSKIIRTWKVIDWCQGISKSWSYLQIIEIIDRQKPIITCPADIMFESYAGCNVPITINLPDATATDNCSGLLLIHNDSRYADTAMANASGKYPPGTHTVTYMATDECGNTSTCVQTVIVVDKKPPTVFCTDGVRTTLQAMPGMGVVQSIWAKDLIHKIESPCCKMSDMKVSFDSLGLITQKWFDCSNIGGLNYVCIWVTDCRGNQTKCCVWVDIQDNNNLCTKNQIDSFTLTVCTNHWLCTKPIEGVDFGLLGKTDHTGCLKFKLPKGRINLKPSYDDGDHPNAVTTADIVLIQKHILGKDSLNPYQIIAADVNKSSGSITSADISEIRKLILGANSSFKHNDWVFVPDSLSLNLDRDTTIHFIGVKLGDVNGSWCSHNVGGLLERLSKKDVSLINKLYNQTLIYEQNLGFHDEQGSQVELIDDDSFQIIPNPNVGNFIVVSKKDQEFKLFSPQGVYLLNGKTNTELNWYLKPGLYVIQVLGSSTSRVKKMIVQ